MQINLIVPITKLRAAETINGVRNWSLCRQIFTSFCITLFSFLVIMVLLFGVVHLLPYSSNLYTWYGPILADVYN